jgi:hypothetical protein
MYGVGERKRIPTRQRAHFYTMEDEEIYGVPRSLNPSIVPSVAINY